MEKALLAPRRIDEPGMGLLEIWDLDPSEDFLFEFFSDIFENWWQSFQYGMLIQGGVLEFRPPCKPTRINKFDGYLTVEFGEHGHLHLCIGLNKGYRCTPTSPDVAKIRMPSKLQLYRKLNAHGQPTFWAIRTLNSRLEFPEQTLTIYLPNPLLTPLMEHADPPDWSRLQMWDYLRSKYLKLGPDAVDRSAKRFAHD